MKQRAKMELARREFFFYCQLKAPDFYKDNRAYLVEFCNDLQDFVHSDDDVLVVNMPPRAGKSRTAGLFVEWLLGKEPTQKLMVGSYNETLSTRFSKNVRNSIQEIKATEKQIVYSDIFPGTKIKYGDAAMNLWSLEGTDTSYLATSPSGTATGFGASILIIDDLIKTDKEAFNANLLEEQWSWFTDTMLSRLESGGKIIIIMTRWSSNDLAGRALKEMPLADWKVKHISLKAYDEETDTMLCDEVLSKRDYQRKIKTMGEEIARANYQQEPIDLKGTLYKRFKTYDRRADYIKTWEYCDTADKGEDYLFSVVFGETKEHQAEVLSIIFTQKDMDITETLVANQLIEYNVNHARIEGNNGGVGFARSVKRKLKEKNWYKTVVEDFHQSANKDARILSNATWIEENVFYPEGWETLYPEFAVSMKSYQKAGKNAHDDAQDGMTGIAETLQQSFKPKDLPKPPPMIRGRRGRK